ncbi:MAG: transposase [Candidatus Methanoperedens sp.]|nr:transposase [Candidatus Methanoperedens sp.]
MGGERKEQKRFNELVKKLKDNDFKYTEKEEKLRDWSKYDKAQIHEINDMLLIIADFVDESGKRLKIERYPEKGPGRPSYPPVDIAKAILMQQYLGMANRSIDGTCLPTSIKQNWENDKPKKTEPSFVNTRTTWNWSHPFSRPV